jgi:hypothetical protein
VLAANLLLQATPFQLSEIVSELQRPQGRVNKAKFANVGDVLDKVTQGLSLDRRLREHALRQIWPTLVGEPFAQRSRVLFVDSDENLVIAVSDASSAQEMSFSKRALLNKIYPAARALGLKIKGMRFDLKQFFSKFEPPLSAESGLYGRSRQPGQLMNGPQEDELNSINLAESERSQVEELTVALKSVEELSLVGSSQDGSEVRQWSTRITKIVEHQLRLESWRRSQNFPNCSKCFYPTSRLHTELGLCTQCYLKKLGGAG